MGTFVDRADELATLEEQFVSDEASMVIIYGRRRVGKTALITEFLKERRGLYFLATEESEEQNRFAFQKEAAAFCEDDLLAQVTVDNWDILFDRLTQGSQKTVIALDEFQYLGKANPAFPSIFQRIWDTMLSKRNVMVILCGSLISLMESQTLSYSSPLYGRRTAQIRMKQIPFRFYHEFFSQNLDRRALVERYSVTGGVPKYIESFKEPTDIYQAIANKVLNPNSYLFDEPNFLLSKEVVEAGSYFSILKAIAAGRRKGGEIASALRVKQTNLSKYLKVLERLDVLTRDVPVTELNPEKSKKGLYRITDNYLKFWFSFLFPNRGLLETGRSSEVLSIIEKSFIDQQVAFAYEDICRDRLWDASLQGLLPFKVNRVGSWWGAADVELDVVGLSTEEGRAVFGECKFWKSPVGVNVLNHLEEQASKALKTSAFGPYRDSPQYVLFSISGFTAELREVALRRGDVLLLE
ncbi:ATP-binding protein [Adlercreutzia sp. R25]|uniref:ATP-binding protein n=1 Tax=Adlercreutzia shanghongiae TaxID=3111773 RepID=UPI002DBD1F65|nr:ATP-binding protein [Adlercreutzia sp. R25]MEC4273681.1 ATP-binding protein [Adlercreutzia sp. R25]